MTNILLDVVSNHNKIVKIKLKLQKIPKDFSTIFLILNRRPGEPILVRRTDKNMHACSQKVYKTWKIQTSSIHVFEIFTLKQQKFVQDVKVN